MGRPLRSLALSLFALLGTLHAQTPVQHVRAILPAVGTQLTVRATLPVPKPAGGFQRFACPYKLRDPFGIELPTQWELVARLRDRYVVELLAPYTVLQEGRNDFDVVLGSNTFSLQNIQPEAIATVATQNAVRLVVEDQNGGQHTISLSGPDGWVFPRLGLARVTGARHRTGEFGDWHSWFTLDANRRQIGLTLNLHNGSLPARPDLYFQSIRLEVPAGWAWTPLLPDPVSGNGYLVQPGQHVLPQRMQRAFRVVIHPAEVFPHLGEEGWGVGDWHDGGYLAQDHALPILDLNQVSLLPDAIDAYQRLATFQPTFPGSPPVHPLWPAKGVYYGGMTGGIEIFQIPGVELAVKGQPVGLLYYLVDQLRYGARHRTPIYEPNGEVIQLDDYLNADGSAPWVMFNSTFLGNPPMDHPFGFHLTGPGVGWAPYDPTVFDPIDSQHLVRRLNANRVLAWLANDPLAKLYMQGDAELARMTFFEGPGGRMTWPNAAQGMGGTFGRGEAWACEALATAYALGDGNFRARTLPWFQRYVDVLSYMQMPNGMFSATETGKIAEDPPYGDGSTAFYAAHRSNEQIQLGHGLRAIQEAVGIYTNDQMRLLGDGLWTFAWKQGFNGVLDRYPASPAGANYRWATSQEFPGGLTTIVPNDGYHVGTVLAYAIEAGSVHALSAVLAHTNQPTLAGARWQLEAWGTENLANRAPLLWMAQRYFP